VQAVKTHGFAEPASDHMVWAADVKQCDFATPVG